MNLYCMPHLDTVANDHAYSFQMKELPTYKDNDFLEEGCKLYLPRDAKKSLIDMLTSDTEVSTSMAVLRVL